jgi:hypothetical protein
MRSILYDTINDDYNKMVLGEIFRKEKRYKLRSDGYSRHWRQSQRDLFTNVAWWRPEALKSSSRIEFTALQWRRDKPTQIGVKGWSIPLIPHYATFSFARARDQRIFASGWRMAVTI